MKFRILIICCFLFSSCSVFFPEGIVYNSAGFDYNYQSFNKSLDEDDKSSLLNPTKIGNSKLKTGLNLAYVMKFFKDELGSNVIKNKEYKNKEGKPQIPFNIPFDISDEQSTFLKENTNLYYVILTKKMYLNQLQKAPLSIKNRARFMNSMSSAMSFIKIIDQKLNTILLEMNCNGVLTVLENKDLNTGQVKLQPKSIHKDSYGLGENQ